MIVVLSLLGVVAALVYFWWSQHYSYWSRRGVVQPFTLPLCGNMLPVLLQRASIGFVYDQIYRTYPEHDAVGVYSLSTPKLLLRSPQLIQKVLISDFSSFRDNEFTVNKTLEPDYADDPFCAKGDAWKLARTKLSSTLSVARVKEIFPLMRELVPRVDNYIDQRSGQDIDSKELAGLFTMDTVSDCVFGITSNCFTDPQAVFRKMADVQKVDVMQSWWRTLALNMSPTVRDIMKVTFIPASVTAYIKKIVRDVLEYRMKEEVTRNDLFNNFIKKTADAEDPEKEIFSLCLSFFVDSFETAALTASRVLYELALNPRVQQTLHAELKDGLGEQLFQPDYETLTRLPYLDQVICESQRKYPVLMTLSRACTQPTQLHVDGNTVTIQPDTVMIVPVFSLHRDPCYFPDPDKFDPDRFSESKAEARPYCTFMPFGEGPRICPGVKFALAQVKLLISDIVLKYEVLKSERTPKKLTFAPGSFLLVPNEKLWIQMRKRTQ